MSDNKVKLSEKFAYALGDAAAGGIVWKVMSIAFPLFFTNIFGLSFADAAMLMLVARLFDVVTDPIMGSLADRTRSRWGTYRPWLIFGAIPLGLVFALLLYTPELGPVGKRIYAYTLYLLMMAVYTAVNVPYGSLLGVMTDDDNQKNSFSSFRMVGAYAMGFVTLLSFPYLQKMVGGSDAHQYAVLGAILGGVAAVLTLLCGLFTKERLKPVRAEKYSFKQFADLFKNKPWLILTAAGICTNFFNGFRYAVVGYMIDYCLDGNVTVGSLIINYTVLMAFGEVTCMIFGGLSPKFTTMVGSKRGAFIGASLICIVTSVLFFFIPMDPAYIWVMIGMVVLTSMGIGLYSPLLWSMYSDVADYATEKFGTSSTGLIFSSGTMSQKLGSAISGSLIAMLLGLSGAEMVTDAMGNSSIDPASVTDSVRTMVWSLFSLIPAAIAALMALLTFAFPIKKKMNPMHTRKVIITSAMFAVLCAACFLLPKVKKDNQISPLKVEGTRLVNDKGEDVCLKGVSLGWNNIWPRFYNAGTIQTLHKDWGCKLFRAAIAADDIASADNPGIRHGYIGDPEFALDCLYKVVDAAIEEGCYIIVDWHSHLLHTEAACQFFSTVATRYKGVPNVIYELYNEPVCQSFEDSRTHDDLGDTEAMQAYWETLKEYANAVIAAITAVDDSNPLILMGCPSWDQRLELPAQDPIEGYDNLMYTMHFYAATHEAWLRDVTDYAIKCGRPVFITECAGTEASGDGRIGVDEWKEYTEWAESRGLSVVTWSISDKNETCSMLTPEASDGGPWDDAVIKPWGKMVKEWLNK